MLCPVKPGSAMLSSQGLSWRLVCLLLKWEFPLPTQESGRDNERS